METVLIVVHLMVVLALVGVVLLQRSEGGALGMGGGGGGGGGGGFMSARGAANALTRTTAILAVAFFATSIALGIFAQDGNRTEGILDNAAQQTGVPNAGGEATPGDDVGKGQGGILDDLQPAQPAQPEQPSTGVPASE